jgi:hypothetical protein
METLVGRDPSRDDIAVLALRRSATDDMTGASSHVP